MHEDVHELSGGECHDPLVVTTQDARDACWWMKTSGSGAAEGVSTCHRRYDYLELGMPTQLSLGSLSLV